ncbi:MAG: glucose 1-dehydrogenase [Spirochaetes bacterium]|nr:glucose 1-dehydrogenase [Spirochaetota bacterium]
MKDSNTSIQYKDLFRLDGKVAVVTGASGGIGRGIALALAAYGADILAAGRNMDKVRKTVEMAQRAGKRAAGFSLEITSKKSADDLARTALETLGGLDILVNSAGMNIRKEVLDITDEDWDPVIDVNLKGVLYCCQSAARIMIERKGGKIINIASISSVLGHPARGSYAASKGGLIQLSRVMSTEWAPYNICVNSISPAAVDTPFIDGLKKNRERLDRELQRIPLGRIATVDDVVGAALLFASKAGDFITGQNLLIDGGRTVD